MRDSCHFIFQHFCHEHFIISKKISKKRPLKKINPGNLPDASENAGKLGVYLLNLTDLSRDSENGNRNKSKDQNNALQDKDCQCDRVNEIQISGVN